MVLAQNRRSPNLSSPVVFANCLLFFCCTAHFALEFNHFYTTLVGFPIKSLENTYPHTNFLDRSQQASMVFPRRLLVFLAQIS